MSSFMLNRVARTVIIGGIVNADMAKEVHQLVQKCGTICSVTYPLPKEEIESHGKTIYMCFHFAFVLGAISAAAGYQIFFMNQI